MKNYEDKFEELDIELAKEFMSRDLSLGDIESAGGVSINYTPTFEVKDNRKHNSKKVI